MLVLKVHEKIVPLRRGGECWVSLNANVQGCMGGGCWLTDGVRISLVSSVCCSSSVEDGPGTAALGRLSTARGGI
jgi:hypothetical protein